METMTDEQFKKLLNTIDLGFKRVAKAVLIAGALKNDANGDCFTVSHSLVAQAADIVDDSGVK